jgi:hypothetical protein
MTPQVIRGPNPCQGMAKCQPQRGRWQLRPPVWSLTPDVWSARYSMYRVSFSGSHPGVAFSRSDRSPSAQ